MTVQRSSEFMRMPLENAIELYLSTLTTAHATVQAFKDIFLYFVTPEGCT
jgi:hypothetical protein